MSASRREALLITGSYGTGKSAVAAGLADELERRSIRFAAIDLDWLAWFDPGEDPGAEERIFLANLGAVIANYRSIGIGLYVLAGSVGERTELAALAATLDTPIRVVRLTAPLEIIERRLRADHRPHDIVAAREQVAADLGSRLAERTIENTGPIAETIEDILEWLGWMEWATHG